MELRAPWCVEGCRVLGAAHGSWEGFLEEGDWAEAGPRADGLCRLWLFPESRPAPSQPHTFVSAIPSTWPPLH